MRDSLRRLIVLAVCVAFAGSFAFAQGTASLSGTVVDTGGGVIPGATVVVKNDATGESQSLVSNASGAFSIPGIAPGTYTVTVSLSGFKTVVINTVRILASTAATVTAKLEVGQLTESVEVTAGADLVQTQSATVQSTLKAEQLKELPLVSRNALYAVAFLPGVESPMGVNGNGPRQSTINGLPQNTINITIDGISTGNPLQSGDGFFSMVTPRLDAVEEITVTGAVPGSGGGQGSVQVAFVTRSGTNKVDASVYDYLRRPQFNSNYFFNKIRGLPRNQVIVDQYGGRLGGPIVIPGLVDGRGKAFFFFNFEHLHQPSSATRTRTILNPFAENGVFSYTVNGATTQIDLLALAARTGFTATADPTIAALIAQIRASTNITGVVSTPAAATNTQSFVFQSESKGDQYAPTTKLDFNLTPKHRLTGTYWWQRFKSNPDLLNNVDRQYPGFPNFATQNSYRTTGSVALRSTVSSTIVNEVLTGWQWSPNEFFTNVNNGMFANQGGYNLGLPLISSPTATASPAPRNTSNINFQDTLSWLRGNHSFSFGAGGTYIVNRATASTVATGVTLGLNTANDPANAMFTTANFPGASTTNLNDARSLYALITGRVTAINGTGRLDSSTGKYVFNGDLEQAATQMSYYGYAQDAWKLKPNVTLNLGLRYEVQGPFNPITNTYSVSDLASLCGISGIGNGVGGRECNLFQPGNLPAGATVTGTYQPFTSGKSGFKTDFNNFAPNVGLAWQPRVDGGFMRKILGDPDTATLRGGYSWSYNLERIDRYTGIFGNNPGGTTTANRNVNNGNLVLAGQTWPVLLRDSSRITPISVCTGAVTVACMPEGPAYPIAATSSNSVNIVDPDIKTPHVESWSMGFQRSIDRNTAVEVRYLGNRNQDAWTTEQWNERVLFENGFIDEFKRAMANIQANSASGVAARAGSYAYFGPGTGTSPLPIYMAYFLGKNAAAANDAAQYTGTNWTNTAYTADLAQYSTNITSTANDLAGDATFRTNALAAGLPANFFQMNPNIGNANVLKSLAGSRYQSLQVDVRRRLARGLLVQANYTYAKTRNSNLQSLRFDRFYLESAGVPHAFKMNWTYDVPFGRGRRFGSNSNALLNGILGGWEYSGTGRVQRQQYNAGSVRLVGMTKADLQKAFHIRIVKDPTSGTVTVFSMDQDIIDNTRAAFSADPTTATGYSTALGVPTGRYIASGDIPGCVQIYIGDCGTPQQVFVYGPAFVRFDMRIKKLFSLGGKRTAEIDFEVLNVFDNINFNHQMNPGSGTGIFQVTTAYTDINTTFDPGGRLGQLVWRVTW